MIAKKSSRARAARPAASRRHEIMSGARPGASRKKLIRRDQGMGVLGLTVVSKQWGCDGAGLDPARKRSDQKMIRSYAARTSARRTLSAGKLELEFKTPGYPGRARSAGGAGHPAFVTKTGSGPSSPRAKEERELNGEALLMERVYSAISHRPCMEGDTEANLVYRKRRAISTRVIGDGGARQESPRSSTPCRTR